MLASLLPGLRDLRAPLAAGYLWLAAGWLYFAPQLPASVNDAAGVLKDIYRVVDASNSVAVAAGLTFIAYLLGILSTGFLTPVVGIIFLLLALPIVLLLLAVSRIKEYLKERRQGLHLMDFEENLWGSFKRRRFWTSAEDRKLDLPRWKSIDPDSDRCRLSQYVYGEPGRTEYPSVHTTDERVWDL
jgi:hypothetical protein